MKIRRLGLLCLLTLVSASWLSSAVCAVPATAIPNPARWEARVKRYLEKDRADPPPVNGIVFIGSSSIEMWQSLTTDFPSLPVVRRGINGTWLADLPQFAPQLVYPLKPRVVVVYAGENDLQSGRTAHDVVSAFVALRDQIHAAVPDAPVVYLAIKPSPRRGSILGAIRDANSRIAALCAEDPLCTFVDVFTPMLDSKGAVRSELFSADRLHMNADGYRLWTELLAPVLARLEPRKP